MLVNVTEENNIMKIALNRADKKNAFNPEMIQQITQAFESVQEKPHIQGVYLTGEGDCFSAGADLQWMKSMVAYNLEENKQDSSKLYNMFKQGLACPVPVLGYFKGYVMGGATGLAAICDVGVSLSSTMYCFSEVKIGLVPAVISPFILNKMISNKANEYMLTAKLFNAEEALNSGLVEYVGDSQFCDEVIEKILRRFKQSGPIATRETKKLIAHVRSISIEQSEELTTQVISERRVSDEGQEGLASFFEKRKPNWVRE